MDDRLIEAIEFGLDQFGADDRRKMTVEDHFGTELANGVDRRRAGERVAITITSNRDQVREMSEGVAKEISGQDDLVLRKPDDERIVRFGTRNRNQLNLQSTERKGMAVLEGDIGGWTILHRVPGDPLFRQIGKGALYIFRLNANIDRSERKGARRAS